jgi:ketosteroid isomerase-like protein
VWDVTNLEGWPEDPLVEGADEVRQTLEDWVASWDSFEPTFESFHDAGADKVVVCGSQRMTGPESGVPVQFEFTSIFTVRNGKVAHIAVYSDRGKAFETAGLSE